eukprot:g874.t1
MDAEAEEQLDPELDVSFLGDFASDEEDEQDEQEKAPKTAALDQKLLFSAEHWRGLCPRLNCSTALESASASTSLPPELVGNAREDLCDDGYFQLAPEDLALDTTMLDAVAESIRTLVREGWHPLWIIMFDEIWLLVHQLSAVLHQATGNQFCMDFFACEVLASFRADRTPKYTTIWIPFTDATAHNSCLYVVPAGADPTYNPKTVAGTNTDAQASEASADKQNPLSTIFQTPAALQHIRALPGARGSALVFSHRLMHWGGVSCKKRYKRSGTAQLLTYSANYPLSSEATQELFTAFIAQSAHFGPRFAKRVCQVGAVQELIRQRHAKAAGAAV